MKISSIILFIMITAISAVQLSAVLYQVGPGKPYTNLQAVAPLLQAGDVVEVFGDTVYPGDVVFTQPGAPDNKITIRGITVNGNRPVIYGGTNTVQFQTPWPYTGPGADHYIFENFDITAGSSRGIYHQSDDLTIRNVLVHDCPAHGILGADQGSGSLTLQYTEVYFCGSGSSQHQIYMATDEVHYPGSVFRMEYCYIHDGNGGNNVKTRAERNEIYYNWIEGAFYHELEMIGPDGGDGGNPNLKREDSDVVGNVLWSKNDFYLTRVGGDGTGETYGRYRFVNNTFICMSRAAFRLFDGIESIEMHNNVFYRQGNEYVDIIRTVDAVWASGSEVIAGSGNWVDQDSGSPNIPSQWTGTLFGSDPGFKDIAGGDLRLSATSILKDAGAVSLSSPPGYPFPSPLAAPLKHPPLHELLPIDTARSRPAENPIDLGAFEYYPSPDFPDFDNDGHVDILWRHQLTGVNGVWYMDGGSRTGNFFLPSLNNQWQCVGTADFNNDGKADIIWRHKTSGQNGVWFMNGVIRTGQAYFPTLADTFWQIAGVADFNDDGKTDILWRHSGTGQNGIWFMNGTTRTGIQLFNTLSPEWQCGGVADFNNDGKVDIMWRSNTDGRNGVWYMNNATRTGQSYLPTLSKTEWECVGLGDFNNDEKPDIMWRNRTSGQNGVWLMNGTSRTGFVFPPTLADTDWRIVN